MSSTDAHAIAAITDMHRQAHTCTLYHTAQTCTPLSQTYTENARTYHAHTTKTCTPYGAGDRLGLVEFQHTHTNMSAKMPMRTMGPCTCKARAELTIRSRDEAIWRHDAFIFVESAETKWD
eukprot:962160-Pelagomonas_calceolata.AAC.1